MLQLLRTWLDNPKDYYVGVALYSRMANKDVRLLALYKKGETPFTVKKIRLDLQAAYDQLSQGETGSLPEIKTLGPEYIERLVKEDHPIVITEPANIDLYLSCKKESDLLFKEIMNKRAELFALARADDFTDPNMPDKIEARRKLSLDVVTGYQRVSELYDKADFVKLHGYLPGQPLDDQEDDYDTIPDLLVKPTLDNLRKNYNKLKHREQTPERVALAQKHEANIKKLEARWLLLKQK